MAKPPGPGERTVLVEVAHTNGTAAIVRHCKTGKLWLTADLEDGEWSCARCGWQAYRYHEMPDELKEIEIPEGVRKLGRAVGKVAAGGLKRLEAHLVGSIAFDVHGLGVWAGPRSVGGYSTDPIRIDSIALHHGEPKSRRAHGDLDLTVASTGPPLEGLDLVVIDDLSAYDRD